MPLLRIVTFSIGLIFSAISVNAQDMLVEPRLYDVTRVASNDVLNVREKPSASSAKIGELAHNNLAVEVIALSANGKWGLVNSDDQSGWVSMQFMKPSLAAHEPPLDLACAGTEPFWSLIFDPSRIGQADWSMMGLTESESFYEGFWTAPAVNRSNQSFAFSMSPDKTGSGINASGIISTEICSDGMSDRVYGYAIDLILSGSQTMYVTGCCSVGTN